MPVVLCEEMLWMPLFLKALTRRQHPQRPPKESVGKEEDREMQVTSAKGKGEF